MAARSLAAGHHPFGAVLVLADGETVLMEQGNVDAVNHAEAVLAREAAARFDAATLWGCTLVTTVEPCAMCAGTQYWAHVGRVVYGMPEHDLLALTGAHPENATLDLPCREVFARPSRTFPRSSIRRKCRSRWARRIRLRTACCASSSSSTARS